ncbi:hypothetical protein [Streptomyces niveus]|uniref:hypothetical protein n=1 Tax=Streptomyces niveus TaxID=193462 RepID=UPI000A617F18|nr:hypothetical protein [Streptomyces niveus]
MGELERKVGQLSEQGGYGYPAEDNSWVEDSHRAIENYVGRELWTPDRITEGLQYVSYRANEIADAFRSVGITPRTPDQHASSRQYDATLDAYRMARTEYGRDPSVENYVRQQDTGRAHLEQVLGEQDHVANLVGRVQSGELPNTVLLQETPSPTLGPAPAPTPSIVITGAPQQGYDPVRDSALRQQSALQPRNAVQNVGGLLPPSGGRPRQNPSGHGRSAHRNATNTHEGSKRQKRK